MRLIRDPALKCSQKTQDTGNQGLFRAWLEFWAWHLDLPPLLPCPCLGLRLWRDSTCVDLRLSTKDKYRLCLEILPHLFPWHSISPQFTEQLTELLRKCGVKIAGQGSAFNAEISASSGPLQPWAPVPGALENLVLGWGPPWAAWMPVPGECAVSVGSKPGLHPHCPRSHRLGDLVPVTVEWGPGGHIQHPLLPLVRLSEDCYSHWVPLLH